MRFEEDLRQIGWRLGWEELSWDGMVEKNQKAAEREEKVSSVRQGPTPMRMLAE